MSDAIDTTFDLIIIGSGPGGYTAAIRASQLGLKTAIVEREQLGGICLNWGCIPTKALLRSAELYRDIGRAQDHGFGVSGPVTVDLQRLVARSRGAASKLSGGVRYLMKKNAIRVIEGQGALGLLNAGGLRSVRVSRPGQPDTKLQAPRVILATGARARQLPGIDADGLLVWTYRDALMPPALPGSLLVVGSGAIGIEFASFYRALGVSVTVVEAMDRVLPAEDAEISGIARVSFERQGTTFHTATQLEAVDKGVDNVTASLRRPNGALHRLTVDRVLLAVGICGNVESLGLENTRVRVEKTHVAVGPFSQTDEPGIYAIGDIVPGPALAHVASAEGIICVEKIAGHHPEPLKTQRHDAIYNAIAALEKVRFGELPAETGELFLRDVVLGVEIGNLAIERGERLVEPLVAAINLGLVGGELFLDGPGRIDLLACGCLLVDAFLQLRGRHHAIGRAFRYRAFGGLVGGKRTGRCESNERRHDDGASQVHRRNHG